MFLSHWLERFVYRTTSSWWIIAAGTTATVMAMMAAISWHTWQAAQGQSNHAALGRNDF